MPGRNPSHQIVDVVVALAVLQRPAVVNGLFKPEPVFRLTAEVFGKGPHHARQEPIAPDRGRRCRSCGAPKACCSEWPFQTRTCIQVDGRGVWQRSTSCPAGTHRTRSWTSLSLLRCSKGLL